MRVFATLLILCLAANAETYYVRTDGNDSNSGTANTSGGAWLTIQKAANTMVAGDTVLVAAGTYSQKVASTTSGSLGNPITFQAQASVTLGGFTVAHSFIVIQGFTITGSDADNGAVTISGGGHNLTLRSNIFNGSPVNTYQVMTVSLAEATNTWIEGNQFLNSSYNAAVSLESSGHTITNNYWSGTNGADALRLFCSNTRVVNNTFTDWSNLTSNANHTDLFQSFTGLGESITNILIEGNVAINCINCQIGNIEDQDEQGRVGWWTWRNNIFANVTEKITISGHNFYFYNNTFYQSASASGSADPLQFRPIAGRGSGHNGKVFNNIFFKCGTDPSSTSQGAYWFETGVTNCQANYNLIIGTGAGTSKTAYPEANGINGQNPLFVNAAGNNFRLQTNSPAIGAGTNLSSTFTTDYTGATRSGTWDIGAYEYVPPTGNSATVGTLTIY